MNKRFLIFTVMILSVWSLTAADSVAKTLNKKGTVYLTRDLKISKINVGDELINNDELETADDSYAAIKFIDDASIIKLFPSSILKIITEKKNEKYLKKNTLSAGKFWAKVTKHQELFEVITPSTTCSVKGTEFLIDVADDGTTECYTFDGEVQMINNSTGASITISAGKKGQSKSDGIINVASFEESEIDPQVLQYLKEEFTDIQDKKPEEKPHPVQEFKPYGITTPEEVIRSTKI